MLQSEGAELLVLASKIETPFMTLENAKTVLDDLKLAYGRALMQGVLPFARGLNQLNQDQLQAIANHSLMAAKVAASLALYGALSAGINRAAAAVRSLSLAYAQEQAVARVRATFAGSPMTLANMAAYGRALKTAREQAVVQTAAARSQALMIGRGIVGYGLLAAAVLLVINRVENYQQTLERAKELQVGLIQQALKFQQHMQALGIEQAPKPTLAASTPFDSQTAHRVEEMQSAMQAYRSDLSELGSVFGEGTQAAQLWHAELNNVDEAIEDFREKAVEAYESGQELGENFAWLSDLALNEYVPAIREILDIYAELLAANGEIAADTQTTWDQIGGYATAAMGYIQEGVTLLVDYVMRGLASAGAYIGAFFESVGDSVVLGLQVMASSAISIINSVIESVETGINAVKIAIHEMAVISAPVNPAAAAIASLTDASYISLSRVGEPEWYVTGAQARENAGQAWEQNFAQAAAWARAVMAGDATGLGDAGFDMNRVPDWFSEYFFEGTAYQNLQRELQAKANTEVLKGVPPLLDVLRADLVGVGVRPEEDLGSGKKDGGAAEPTRAELYQQAIESLQAELKELDVRLDLMGQYNEEEAQKLQATRDRRLFDFQVEAHANEWLDLLEGDVEIQQEIAEAYQRYKSALDKIAEEMQKALSQATESVTEQRAELAVRKELGLAVDETKLNQAALNEYIELSAKYGEEFASQYAGLPEAAAGLREALQAQAQKVRELQLDYDLQQLNYQAGLAQAREKDPNRSRGIGINAVLSQLERYVEESDFLEPGSEAAYEMAKKLQGLHVELEQSIHQMRFAGQLTSSGQERAQEILSYVQQMMEASLGRLDAESYIQPLDQSAANLNVSAANLSAAAAALSSAASALGAAAASQASGEAYGETSVDDVFNYPSPGGGKPYFERYGNEYSGLGDWEIDCSSGT
jgi:hypothetical protein